VVVEYGVDLGLVFDGDVDCCFVIDECGEFVSLSVVIVLVVICEIVCDLVCGGMLIVIYNFIILWVVFEIVVECGGWLVWMCVGYLFIKVEMVCYWVVFGGEYLVYYYFCDFWYVDIGMFVVLYVFVVVVE